MGQCFVGDCREVMRQMLADGMGGGVQTCITSPPYFGLRDYGHDGQIGLESTPDAYVEKMVEVFRLVRELLAEDGTLWLNLGDSYSSGGRGGGMAGEAGEKQRSNKGALLGRKEAPDGYKPKDLLGIPWRVAFALQADGWWLRSDIIWSKTNCMPESVTDRPTRSHEYIFLFAKGQWKSGIVKFSDLPSQRIHLGKYVCTQRPDFGPNDSCVVLASAIFDRAQRQEQFGLPSFYSQEWKQCADGGNSNFVCGLPADHIPAVWAARFLDADCTSEQFLEQLHRLGFALSDGGNFLISGTSAISLDTPHIYSDGKGTIAIHHSGKISKIEFLHKRIVVSTPTTCKYYYDHEAIKEPAIYDVDGTGTASRKARTKENHKGMPTAERNGMRPAGFKDAAKMNGKHGSTLSGGMHGRHFLGDAIPEKERRTDKQRGHSRRHAGFNDRWDAMSKEEQCTGMRNKRDVWTVPTSMFKEAHFATFNPKLIEPCILAGAPAGGVVLDPFFGSGTTGQVAERLGRQWIGIELNESYVALAKNRTSQIGISL